MYNVLMFNVTENAECVICRSEWCGAGEPCEHYPVYHPPHSYTNGHHLYRIIIPGHFCFILTTRSICYYCRICNNLNVIDGLSGQSEALYPTCILDNPRHPTNTVVLQLYWMLAMRPNTATFQLWFSYWIEPSYFNWYICQFKLRNFNYDTIARSNYGTLTTTLLLNQTTLFHLQWLDKYELLIVKLFFPPMPLLTGNQPGLF